MFIDVLKNQDKKKAHKIPFTNAAMRKYCQIIIYLWFCNTNTKKGQCIKSLHHIKNLTLSLSCITLIAIKNKLNKNKQTNKEKKDENNNNNRTSDIKN